MVDPKDVWRIVMDAARLLREGEIVVFGSGALAFWLADPPRSRDVDLWCDPRDRGDVVEALMGELSWYHDRHGGYVEVWAPETFAAPTTWRTRAKTFHFDDLASVTICVAHPHDVLLAKLERMDPQDHDHAERILSEFPLSAQRLDELAAESPYVMGRITDPSRVAAFQLQLGRLRMRLGE
jgi:hypothetical protein